LIATKDFSCFICHAMTYKGEEAYQVYTIQHGKIKLCAPCGVGAEALGWDIQ